MKRLFGLVLAFLCLLALAGCKSSSMPEEMPADFSFAVRWNTYGISSYDSQTGKLVKDAEAAEPKDYTIEYFLTEEEMSRIYGYIRELDPYDYPDDYEPRGNHLAEPPHPLYLTVRVDGTEKQIRVRNFSQPQDRKGELYFSTCQAITAFLESTEAWQSLPEYERFFE